MNAASVGRNRAAAPRSRWAKVAVTVTVCPIPTRETYSNREMNVNAQGYTASFTTPITRTSMK